MSESYVKNIALDRKLRVLFSNIWRQYLVDLDSILDIREAEAGLDIGGWMTVCWSLIGLLI